jgi:HD-like signal output (HDOD) protein
VGVAGGATPADAAVIVERDAAMSAKVLALVDVADVREAAVHLGLTTLRGLVLAAHAFEALVPARPIAGFDPGAVRRHSVQVAQVARRLLPQGEARDDAFAAALLHDVGLLVLATEDGDYLESALAQAAASGRPLVEVE